MDETVVVNGREELRTAVGVVYGVMCRLWNTDPIAAYEAVMVARDGEHAPFGSSGKKLEELNLTTCGKMHDTVRNVILSCAVGDGLDMQLVSPFGD